MLQRTILTGTGTLEQDNIYRGALREVEDTLAFDVEYLVDAQKED